VSERPSEWDAATYDRVSAPHLDWGRDVVDRLDLRGDERVLDAGCGTGRVTEMLLERLPRGRVLVHGTAREWGLVQEIVAAAADARVVNIVRGASVARLLALARRTVAMVAVDTGPTHVAAAMDCPMVVLYGGFGAARWKPRTPSADVIALGPEQDNQGTLMDLSAERVLQAFNALRLRP